MDSPKFRILVIDDSAIYRQTICNILRDVASVEVVGTAKNGAEALEKMAELDPDIVTLDYEMPSVDGLEVLRRMKRKGLRAKAIMVSSYTGEGARVTTDALLEGAFDFVLKPSGGTPDENREQLRLALIERLVLVTESISSSVTLAPEVIGEKIVPHRACEAVVIGASTGGPVVLRQLLAEFPADFRVPVIIVQHMPQQFTAPLARRLDEICKLEVVETSNGLAILPGKVYVAAGGRHTKIVRREKDIVARLTEDAPENSCRPSVDYTLRSVTKVYEGRVLATILTGMGRDGLKGCELLKADGGHIFAQHPDGCTVYGMPKAVIQAKLAHRVIPIGQMAREIIGLVS